MFHYTNLAGEKIAITESVVSDVIAKSLTLGIVQGGINIPLRNATRFAYAVNGETVHSFAGVLGNSHYAWMQSGCNSCAKQILPELVELENS